MLTCKEFDDFMVDYLGDGLSVWQKYMCWLHVRMCRECAHFVREYKGTIELGKMAFQDMDDEVPASVPDELIKAALAHRKGS